MVTFDYLCSEKEQLSSSSCHVCENIDNSLLLCILILRGLLHSYMGTNIVLSIRQFLSLAGTFSLLMQLTLVSLELFDMVERFKATDESRLRAEYQRLVDGLAQRGDLRGA